MFLEGKVLSNYTTRGKHVINLLIHLLIDETIFGKLLAEATMCLLTLLGLCLPSFETTVIVKDTK